MSEHTATMGAHVGAMKSHHEQIGGAVGQLYEALMLAQKLLEDLTAAYTELATGHQNLGAAVGDAENHVGTMHEAAQQATEAAAQPN
jgi:outer membrane murein-binding lipoprotein Lpp